jgi:periplasmic divalent cation tolerance protein
MEPSVLLVLCNCPPAVGPALARALVEARVAACVNVSAAVQSVYRWKGALESDAEVTLFIKLPAENMPRLRELIAREHPYELPELLAFPADPALSSAAYQAWVREVTVGEG